MNETTNTRSEVASEVLADTQNGRPGVAKVRLPLVTVSELRTFRRCKREHQISYRLGYRVKDKAGPLRFGSAMHRALERWWLTVGDLEAALATFDETNPEDPSEEPIDPFERAKGRALMMGYHARWSNEDFEVLFVERQFEVALVNPDTGAESRTFRLGGKIDAGIRQAGAYKIVEHKTTSEDIGIDSAYWKRLRIDPQISTYFVGGASLGLGEPISCMYDVIRKPGLKPCKATQNIRYRNDGQPYANQRLVDETPGEYEARIIEDIASQPDRYYQRGDVPRLESDKDEAALDLWQHAREVADADRLGRHPRNPDGCVRFGRVCDYFEVCTGSESLDNEFRFRKSGTAHEELAT